MCAVNLSFCSHSSIVSPKKQPKTQEEIIKEKTAREAEKAKQKSKEERTVGDYTAIALDTVHNIADNVPVVYSTSSQKLNYMA